MKNRPGAGLDWPGMMRAGMRGLGLSPPVFWALTPAELGLLLGLRAGPPPMSRARLREMAARWPDGAKRGKESADGG